MAAIANQNDRHMVQHVLLPVNIHFHSNLFIFEFLTIYFYFFYFYIGSHFVLPIPILFGLSRSTRCGCCSYQVSSISVRRVTCYDHFCVFQFFSILVVSMATVAILKKINP
jgi:hypothetical protein